MKTIIPLTIFPIENDGFHVKVSIMINGKEASMILDTGASRTVFDETRIMEFVDDNHIEDHDRLSSGLGTNSMTSKKVLIGKIQIGEIEIVGYDATILDLQHVNQSYEKLELEPVEGVLGGDILNDYNAVIDYANKELILIS
ncbi:MAG: clan AA aspartic protease [Flavobacteriales bacterium]|nr:clan AA aspartic protease [Flavobacteriales bacterium]